MGSTTGTTSRLDGGAVGSDVDAVGAATGMEELEEDEEAIAVGRSSPAASLVSASLSAPLLRLCGLPSPSSSPFVVPCSSAVLLAGGIVKSKLGSSFCSSWYFAEQCAGTRLSSAPTRCQSTLTLVTSLVLGCRYGCTVCLMTSSFSRSTCKRRNDVKGRA